MDRNSERINEDKFVLIFLVRAFNFLIFWIHMNKNITERDEHLKQTLEFMKILSIQNECMHVIS